MKNNIKKNKEIIDVLLAHEENKPVKPKLPLVIVEKSTSAGLITLIDKNIPNVMQASSEGENITKSNSLSQTGLHNTIWSGDVVNVNTKSGGSVTVVDARLTMNIMIQPSAFELFLKRPNTDIRGNGFLSRSFVCAPISNCGSRYVNEIEHSSENINAFNDWGGGAIKSSCGS